MRDLISSHLRALATLALVSALAAGHAQVTTDTTTRTTTTTRTHRAARARRHAVPKRPSVESQIEQLRQDMQGQIQQLRQQLSDRDAQLQQAQQAAAAAQATAAQATQQAQQQAQAISESNQNVSTLQSSVADLKSTSTSLASTIQDEQTKVQKQINNPDTVHYKGVSLTPGGFLAAETVYRSRATGGGINTPFSGIPLAGQDQAHYSEFYGSGRQSRITLLAQGKLDTATIGGYYEADWLSAGVTSNNNQSNSYTMRQRQVWAQAALNSGWTFTGGQMWTLAAETTKGLQNRSEILPSTIDPQYAAGFVWARQYGFRMTKDFGQKAFFGISAENPQIASLAGHNLPANIVIGQAGVGGGLYNSTANYASNLAPDLIAKLALEPGWGHWEVFGIGRFFRARVYPNDLTTTGTNARNAYNDDTVGGGIGGGFRVPTFAKHLDVGLKGLWGDGIQRYGSTGLADTTVTPGGQLALLHGFSALSTLELHASKRLDVYFNYGGDYVGRRYRTSIYTGKVVGYGAPSYVNTGCNTEVLPGSGGYAPGSLPSTCTADNKDVQEVIGGYWYDFYRGPKGRFRQGIQYSYFQRNTWRGVGGAPKADENGLWTSLRYYIP